MNDAARTTGCNTPQGPAIPTTTKTSTTPRRPATHTTATTLRPALRALSLGAGVQSSALLCLSADGTLPKIDVAIFADTGWSRADCIRYLERLRLADTPKSSCLGCPFHGNSQWRSIRDSSPSEWADVVEFDAAIRQGNARANASGNPLLGQAFLHRSRVPLSEAPINHVTAAEWAALQQEIDAPDTEALEAGVVDGCSPWACRGEQPEPVRDDFGLAL
ncbi:hypothetical protein [Streptomyces lavendulae]|uniref:hypothetical protein n=1 Tax=Streptomyces lavendulae TaxID=1914 RepID=UPI00340DAE5C